jgi:spoIIIJ-associated protein
MVEVKDLVNNMFVHLTFSDAKISVEESDSEISVIIKVPEEFSGMLIGYRGEKINALQLLLTLMINNQAIAYRPLHLDINGYREKRYDSLRDIADAAAQNALDSGREILLSPLPSYERRVIHMYLSENKSVETYSEGEGDQRRLVVRPSSEE